MNGGLFDPPALDQAFAGAGAVVHLVGIIRQRPEEGITFDAIHFQGTRAVIDAARRAGVRRFIQMSALGARPDAPSKYHQTKYAAERYVRESGLDWTIFRPSLIHGPGGEFMQMELAWARGKAPPYLFMPYFGGGLLGMAPARKVQPIAVGDLARAVAEAMENPTTIGKSYDIGGAEQMSWPQMHRMVAMEVTGRPRLTAPLPAWWAKLLTRALPARVLPFNRDQVLMSQEDNVCDLTAFVRDFGWTPAGLSASLETYAANKP